MRIVGVVRNPFGTNNTRHGYQISRHGRARAGALRRRRNVRTNGMGPIWVSRSLSISFLLVSVPRRFTLPLRPSSRSVLHPSPALVALPRDKRVERAPLGRSDRLIHYKGAAYRASSPRQAPLEPTFGPAAKGALDSCPFPIVAAFNATIQSHLGGWNCSYIRSG